MLYWVKGKICVDDKTKMANILLKTNLPLFHYSIFEASIQASKSPIFSINCRISETFFS